MIVLLFLSKHRTENGKSARFFISCGDGFSGRFHVAITTRLPPNNTNRLAALCLLLAITSLCFCSCLALRNSASRVPLIALIGSYLSKRVRRLLGPSLVEVE